MSGDTRTCSDEGCSRLASFIDHASGLRYCKWHAPAQVEEAHDHDDRIAAHAIAIADALSARSTGDTRPLLAGLIASAAFIPAFGWWYDAHVGLDLIFMAVEPDPTPRDSFLADRAGFILLAVSGAVAARIAGFRWLASVVVAACIHGISVAFVVITGALMGPVVFVLVPLMWPCLLLMAKDREVALCERVPVVGMFTSRSNRRIEEVVGWTVTVLILFTTFLHASSLSNQ